MKRLYLISGGIGMAGSELVRQILADCSEDNVIGFDNFYASSIDTIKEKKGDSRFDFFEYDLNDREQMKKSRN